MSLVRMHVLAEIAEHCACTLRDTNDEIIS